MINVCSEIFFTCTLKIDHLKEIIHNFNVKKCADIIKLLLRCEVHIKYRKGKLGIDGKIFEGVLTDKYRKQDKKQQDSDSDLDDKISKISREFDADIRVGGLGRETMVNNPTKFKEEEKNFKRPSKTDEALIRNQKIIQSVDLLHIPERSSLKVNYKKVKNDILKNNRISEKLNYGQSTFAKIKGINKGLRQTFKTIKSKASLNGKNVGVNHSIDSLEKEDIIEIALQYCGSKFDDDSLFSLIKMIYCDEQEIIKRAEAKLRDTNDLQLECFSTHLYHILIYYNKIDIFEACFEIELIYGGYETSIMLLDCISYCIRTNHMMILFHILMKYTDEVIAVHEKIINILLDDINEYTETDGSSHYHRGIHYFEEKLFLLETLVDSTLKEQAQKFTKIALALLKVYIADEDLKSKTKEEKRKEIKYKVSVLIKK